ncbi:MAG: amidohydrolase family protein [Chloroflexi bacterium]|nr:amidohydrolase family protein [Chloroflexota bacterium]MCL5110993.1 amidohydrolase family protein [Chloroflexota bacterium]
MIIDAHTHVFPPGIQANKEKWRQRDAWFADLYASSQARMATADDLVAEMDRSGVDASVICAFGFADPGLLAEMNDYLLAAARTNRGRLLPFIGVQPRAGKAAVAELERCARLGAYGIGELMPDGQGFALDDCEMLAPLVEAAQAHHLPILTHTSEPLGHAYPGKGTVSPLAVYRFAARFAETTLICAHWGGGLPFLELQPEVAAALANVYYDTAAGLYLYRDAVFPAAALAVGPRKILFATDYPLLNQERFIARLRASGLGEAALRLVLGDNAARLLRLRER